MISLTLELPGMKPKTYKDEARMRECLDAYDLAKRWEAAAGYYPPELLEDAARFVCRCFGHRFTQDDLLSGYRGSPFVMFPELLRTLIGYVSDQVADFPPKAATTQARTMG